MDGCSEGRCDDWCDECYDDYDDPADDGSGEDDEGGQGGSGGGGSFTGSPEPPAYQSDIAPPEAPDCTQPQTHPVLIAYCKGAPPNSIQLAKLEGAFDRMRDLGEPCATLANAAQALINAGSFRIWAYNGEDFSGGAGLGGDWALIADVWLNTWETTLTSDGRNLAGAIAHEMDHHLGHVQSGNTDDDGHLIESGNPNFAHTLNSRQCAG